jgi:hypothetical protein
MTRLIFHSLNGSAGNRALTISELAQSSKKNVPFWGNRIAQKRMKTRSVQQVVERNRFQIRLQHIAVIEHPVFFDRSRHGIAIRFNIVIAS